MKNVTFARGCPGMELASPSGLVVDPVSFKCVGWTPSGNCSFASGQNTGVDDPLTVEHDGTHASFDVTFHAGTGWDVTTTYTVYASGRMVVATSLYPKDTTTLPASLQTSHVYVATDFTGTEPVASHVAWALMGTCEVLGLGAAVSPTSLLMLGTNDGVVSEQHPQAPIMRSFYFDVADTKLNPYARAEAAQNPTIAVYGGGSTLGDGIDVPRGNFDIEAGKDKLTMRTAGGSPAFRIDGWGNRPFKISVAGAPVASTAHPATVRAFGDVSPAGTLTVALRGDIGATDDIVIE
jgi:hypothetical protein